MRHQRSRSLSLSRTLWTICFLFKTIVVTSMNAFLDGMYTPLPMRASGIPAPTAFRTICMAITKSDGKMAHPMAMPTCRGIQPVVHSFVEKTHNKSIEVFLKQLIITSN